jgi:hypothetical protein
VTDRAELERGLRQAGAEFISAHAAAAAAIEEAAAVGMSADAIARVSGLSPETVRIFLGAGRS